MTLLLVLCSILLQPTTTVTTADSKHLANAHFVHMLGVMCSMFPDRQCSHQKCDQPYPAQAPAILALHEAISTIGVCTGRPSAGSRHAISHRFPTGSTAAPPNSMLAKHVPEHDQAKPLSLSVRLLWF